MGRYFAGAALFVLPFIISADGGEQMREPKARMLAIMFGLWLAAELWRRVHPALGCAAGFLFVHVFLAPFSFPLYQCLALLGAFGSCLWVANPTKSDVKHGLEILELSGIVVACYALVFQLQGNGHYIHLLPHAIPMAGFGQQTLYGPFAVACFASALFHHRHFRALLLLLPIIVIQSSFTFLSLGVVVGFFAVYRYGKAAFLGGLIAVLLFIGVCKTWTDETKFLFDDQNRFALWGQTYTLGKRHWLVGHGFASFRVIYPIFQNPDLRKANGIDDSKQSEETKAFLARAESLRSAGIFLHPHSEYLSVFFEFGLVGLLLGLWWVASFALSWLQLYDEPENWCLAAIFFSFLANSIGNFPFHLVPQVLLPLWAFVAVTTMQEDVILEF